VFLIVAQEAGLPRWRFASMAEGVDGGGTFAAAVGASEEMVLAAKGYHPFILPMSGRRWKFIIDGTRILAARSVSAGLRNGRLAGFSRSRDRAVLLSR